jgi:hypothetical protein
LPENQPRFARGTSQPEPGIHDERPTKPFARGSDRQGGRWATPTPTPTPAPLPPPPAPVSSSSPSPNHAGAFHVSPLPAPNHAGAFYVSPLPAREATQDLDVIPLVTPRHGEHGEHGEQATMRGRPASNTPPAKKAPRLGSRPQTRGSVPELPGFGEYLVTSGILTRERLRAAQAYQRSMKVQLSTAIVTLGLATPQRIEWASVAHQSQQARVAER